MTTTPKSPDAAAERRTKSEQETATVIDSLRNNADLIEVARSAIEDTLIEFRDARISLPFRSNGLVVREKDGTESALIRIGAETAMRIGLEAIAKHLRSRS